MTKVDDLARGLFEAVPEIKVLLTDHLEDNDEVLSYVLFADVARWATATLPSQRDVIHRVLAWFERALTDNDFEVTNAVALGFVEALPLPGKAGDAILLELEGYPTLHREAESLLGLAPKAPAD